MLLYLFVPQYICFCSCLSMETGPKCWWAVLCQAVSCSPSDPFSPAAQMWLCRGSAGRAGSARDSGGARVGTPPHHPAKPIEWPCPSCSSGFPQDAQKCWEGRCYWNGMPLVSCVIQVRLELRTQQLFPLAVVGCCSCASDKNLKRFWLQMRAAMQNKILSVSF